MPRELDFFPFGGSVSRKFERVLYDLLDVLTCLVANKLHRGVLHSTASKVLWRWVTTLSLLSPCESSSYSASSSTSDSCFILLKLLKLVPFLLFNSQTASEMEDFHFSDMGDPSVRIMTLLSVLIRRLTEESDQIYTHHFSFVDVTTTGTDSKVSSNGLDDFITILKGPNLPYIEPSVQFFKRSVDMERLHGLITCIAQIFSYIKENNYNIEKTTTQNSGATSTILPPKVYLTLLLLLKYEDIQLNLVTLNLIYFYLNNLSKDKQVSLELIFKNYKKLFPRINELLPIENWSLPTLLMSPSKILAELCSKFPLMNDDLRKANLDIQLVTMLTGDLYKNNQELKELKSLKKLSQECTKIVDFEKSSTYKRNENELSDFLLLLSVYSSKKEEYRGRITQSNRSKVFSVVVPNSYTATAHYNSNSNSPASAASSTSSLNLSFVIFDIVDDYRFLLTQIQMIHMMIRKGNKDQLVILGKLLSSAICLLNDSIFTNILYLIRSLSRSVAILRTFFVECNSYPSTMKKSNGSSEKDSFIGNLLHILKGIENCSKIVNYYYKNCNINSSNTDFTLICRRNCLNKSILLGILANFVLDFSSFRISIVLNESFLVTLVNIFNNALPENNNDNQFRNKEELDLEINTIQYNVLQVLQNYTYNETDENKQLLMHHFKFGNLFDKIKYGLFDCEPRNDDLKLKQKVISFDILRNLTSGSNLFSQCVQKEYKEWRKKQTGFSSIGWYSFLTKNLSNNLGMFGVTGNGDINDPMTLRILCKNENYPSLLLAINFIEDHKYTNIENFKDNLKSKEKLFRIWLSFLNLTVTKEFEEKVDRDVNIIVNTNNNLNLIQVSICWIIINLTWKNEIFGSRRSDSVQFKIYDTILIGRVNDRIDIEESDDEDNEDEDDGVDEEEDEEDKEGDGNEDENMEGGTPQEKYSTASERAYFLRDFGFLATLDLLVKRLNGYNRNNGSKRFDTIMGNDLLEKAKTARNQILELTGGLRKGHKVGISHKRSDSTDSKRMDDNTLKTADSSIRRDVNRGGEGYGYESDSEDYVDTLDNNESDQDMEGIEEFDDCWVR